MMGRWKADGAVMFQWRGAFTAADGEGQFKSKRSPTMVVLTGGRDGGSTSAQIQWWMRTSGAQDGQTVSLDGGELHDALFAGSGGSM
jgi:hypothetical protein